MEEGEGEGGEGEGEGRGGEWRILNSVLRLNCTTASAYYETFHLFR